MGKTGVAIRLAQHFQTRIISADSRQCYKELNIGTAKPSVAELQMVPHYFINSHAITEMVTAGSFEQLALGYAQEIFQQNDIALLCGGTGLYVKAFCEGIDAMPAIPAGVRDRIRTQYAEKGFSWLQREVALRDPKFYAQSEQQNPHRLLRALEVLEATGQSISAFRTGQKQARPFHLIKVGLSLPKSILHRRIHQRTDEMIRQGLEEEVRSVAAHRHLNALQTVGYREMLAYLDGQISLEQAIAQIKTNTRHYAKRQLTWFKKDKSVHWFEPEEMEAILRFVTHQLLAARS